MKCQKNKNILQSYIQSTLKYLTKVIQHHATKMYFKLYFYRNPPKFNYEIKNKKEKKKENTDVSLFKNKATTIINYIK